MPTAAELYQLANNPNVRKMLDLIARTEGTHQLHGYNTLVGGKERIGDLSRHPNKVGLVTGDGPSTAAGRYQIVGRTWRGLQRLYGFKDFSPQTQDAAAVALMAGRGALKDILAGDFKSAIGKLGQEWVSLPTATSKHQGKRGWDYVNKFLGSNYTDPAPQHRNVATSTFNPTQTYTIPEIDPITLSQQAETKVAAPGYAGLNFDSLYGSADTMPVAQPVDRTSPQIPTALSQIYTTQQQDMTPNFFGGINMDAIPIIAAARKLYG